MDSFRGPNEPKVDWKTDRLGVSSKGHRRVGRTRAIDGRRRGEDTAGETPDIAQPWDVGQGFTASPPPLLALLLLSLCLFSPPFHIS